MAKGTLFGKPKGEVVKHPGSFRRAAEAAGKFAITSVAIKMGTKVRKLKGFKANPAELATWEKL